jgi:RNA polymerase sigma-70 factor (ECF subfamily)
MSAVAAAAPRSDAASHDAYAERLYERHHRAILGFCLKQLRRREDADDAVQMTFVYALLSLRRGIVPQYELPWLVTIARNVCSTRRRNGMRRGAYETPQDLDAIQDRLAVPERADVATSEDFAEALRAIPEGQRKALLLREWRGLSYEEIGVELGLSQSATEALLFRARQNVARRLGERTGVKTLQGLPLLSFLRNLFQTAAAKIAAIGAGAAIAVAAVPAAQPHTQRHAPTNGNVEHTLAPKPVVREQTFVRPHAARANRADGHRMTAPAVHGSRHTVTHSPQASVVTPAPPGVTSAPPPVPRASGSPQPAAAAPETPPLATPVVKTVDELVGTTVSQLGSAVTLPAVTLPAVAMPTIPSVHLP